MSLKKKAAKYFRCGMTLISPTLNTKVTYRIKFGKKLDLNNPVTFNEKCLWLKLNTYKDNPLVKQCADKYAVREYIKKKGRGDILNHLIGCYKDPDEIKWDELPKRFAIKINCGCGHNIIVYDKATLDIEETKKTLRKWLKMDKWTYLQYSELQYKNVDLYILIEDFIGTEENCLPKDYKFFCMNGVCRSILVCTDRVIGEHAKYYMMDKDWNVLPYTNDAIKNPHMNEKRPEQLDEAIKIAEEFAKDFPQVRVDFFFVGNRIFFGELTFTTGGAMWTDLKVVADGATKSSDEILGSFLTLPKK